MWPSHIDLNTQERYQNLDSNFVGFIFGLYCEPQSGVEVICFQTDRRVDGGQRSVPFKIIPGPSDAYVFTLTERMSVCNALHTEEVEAFESAVKKLPDLSDSGKGG